MFHEGGLSSGQGGRIAHVDALVVVAVLAFVSMTVCDRFMANAGDSLALWWLGNLVGSAGRFAVPVLAMCSGAVLLDPSRQQSINAFYLRWLPRLAAPLGAWSVAYYLAGRATSSDMAYGLGQLGENILNNQVVGHLAVVYMFLQLFLAAPFLGLAFVSGDRRLLGWFAAVCFALHTGNPLLKNCLDVHLNAPMTMFSIYLGYFALGAWLRGWTPSGGAVAAAAAAWVAALAVTSLGNYGLYVRGAMGEALFIKEGALNVAVLSASTFVLFQGAGFRGGGRWSRALAAAAGASFCVFLSHELVRKLLSMENLDAGALMARGFSPVVALAVGIGMVYGVSLALALLIRATPVVRRVLA